MLSYIVKRPKLMQNTTQHSAPLSRSKGTHDPWTSLGTSPPLLSGYRRNSSLTAHPLSTRFGEERFTAVASDTAAWSAKPHRTQVNFRGRSNVGIVMVD